MAAAEKQLQQHHPHAPRAGAAPAPLHLAPLQAQASLRSPMSPASPHTPGAGATPGDRRLSQRRASGSLPPRLPPRAGSQPQAADARRSTASRQASTSAMPDATLLLAASGVGLGGLGGGDTSLAAAAPRELTAAAIESSPDLLRYLDHLASQPLDAVRREPEQQAQEQARQARQLSTMAFSEYKAFVRAHESCAAQRGAARDAAADVAAVAASLPALAGSLRALEADARAAAADRDALARVLAQHEAVVEVLDVPRLFDTLVRGGHYEEAMDLQIHVQRLPARYPHLPVVARVARQVDASAGLMLAQLIRLLRGPVKLPLCIRVIGYLRRMGAFAEPELRLVFLQQRDVFLAQQLAAVGGPAAGSSTPTAAPFGPAGDAASMQQQPLAMKPQSSHESSGGGASHAPRQLGPGGSLEYLKRYIEVSREHFFDIITQYKAIFTDSQPVYAPGAISRGGSSGSGSGGLAGGLGLDFGGPPSSTASIFDTSASYATQSILSSYVSQRVSQLVAELRTHLLSDGAGVEDVAGVSAVLTQAMYYGMSLGRVGIDFRQCVAGVFEDAVERIVRVHMARGVDEFVAWAARSRLMGLYMPSAAAGLASSADATPRASQASAASLSGSSVPASASASGSATMTGTRAAPVALMSYPPLGALVNAFAVALNQLRVLPATALARPLAAFMGETLGVAMHALAQIAAEDAHAWSDARRAEFEDACRAAADVAVPFLAGALADGVYGGGGAAASATAAAAPAGPAASLASSSAAAAAAAAAVDVAAVCAPIEPWAAAARRRAAAHAVEAAATAATAATAAAAVSPPRGASPAQRAPTPSGSPPSQATLASPSAPQLPLDADAPGGLVTAQNASAP
ncbi:hypothetical protein HK105_207974 [Polyrhizophydium stewartii]|uniref:Conserved oligomeric Golgi complex subunit 8 n=1 Tax=Polyrhizophydium stewartii TaxID=2732419 RepID=A0ABR4MZ77_9FUNG